MLVSATYRQASRAGLLSVRQCDRGTRGAEAPCGCSAGGGTLKRVLRGACTHSWPSTHRLPLKHWVRRSLTSAVGGLEWFSQLPKQGIYTEHKERANMKARAVTEAGPDPLIPHSLDQPTPKRLSHFPIWSTALGQALAHCSGSRAPLRPTK